MYFNTILSLSLYVLLTLLSAPSLYAHGLSHQRMHTLDHEIERYPKDPTLYIRRGRIYQETKQWDDALFDFETALLIDPTFYKAFYWQGNTLLRKGDYEQAEKSLLKYLNKKPDSPSGHSAIAKVYIKLGNHLKAADHLDLAISNDNNPPPQVYLERAQVLFKVHPIPDGRINRGLNEAIKKHGSISTYLELFINLNINTKNYQQALVWIDKLPTNLKRTTRWLIKKAELEAQKGDQNNALKFYQMSIESIKNLPQHKQNLPVYVAMRKKAKRGIDQILEFRDK